MGWIPIDLMVPDVDLFRVGNAGGPRLYHVRDRDVDTVEHNGTTRVIANGKGISLTTQKGLDASRFGGHVYMLPAGTALPGGLKLNHDDAHHYSLCPTHPMPLSQFLELCRALAPALSFVKVKK